MMKSDVELTAAREPVYTADSGLAVEAAWPTFEQRLRKVARELSDDPDEQEDLLQAALIELWWIDPTRFDLVDQDDVAYLGRALVHRMRDVGSGRKKRLEEMADPRAYLWPPTPEEGGLAP